MIAIHGAMRGCRLQCLLTYTNASSLRIRVAIPLLAPLAFGCAWTVAEFLVVSPIIDGGGPQFHWEKVPIRTLSTAFLLYLWTGAYLAVNYAAQARSREQSALHMRNLATEAQLAALHYQLNPHFLFNALNAARALVLDDPHCARAMITEIAGFLRFALDTAPNEPIPLARELDAIGKYLAIEKARFEDAVDIAIHTDPGADAVLVPPMLLVPLVENACKHGTPDGDGVLRLAITTAATKRRLTLTVANTGRLRPAADLCRAAGQQTPSRPPRPRFTGDDQLGCEAHGDHFGAAQPRHGLGLDNLRARLQRAFPESSAFSIRERVVPDSGGAQHWVVAEIVLDLDDAHAASWSGNAEELDCERNVHG